MDDFPLGLMCGMFVGMLLMALGFDIILEIQMKRLGIKNLKYKSTSKLRQHIDKFNEDDYEEI